MIFNDVGDFKVTNPETAKIYLDEMLFEFRTYVLGTYFKVKQNSSKISLQVDQKLGDGIWVG